MPYTENQEENVASGTIESMKFTCSSSEDATWAALSEVIWP